MIRSLIAVALVGLSALAVATFPRSVLVFLLFQGSLLYVFKARMPDPLRWEGAEVIAVEFTSAIT